MALHQGKISLVNLYKEICPAVQFEGICGTSFI